jgi:penicillin-binding protein 1C
VSLLKDQNLRDAAVLVVENKTGAVLAYVASSAKYSTAAEVDGIRAKRQAGSSLKPFLYGLAWEKKILNPHSPLLDEPFEMTFANGTYHPENYDHQYHGLVEAQVALASSLNIPAIRVLNLVGVESFRDRLSELGFSALLAADSYGPSLALGTADVSLWDLVNAYRTLANEGVYSGMRLTATAGKNKRRVYSVEASRMVAEAISNSQNRLLGFGWDNILSTPYPSAVKTGTSKDMRDNWCVGFSKDYTVGVWVGNFGGEPMQNVSGVSGAAPIWRTVMNQLNSGKQAQAFPKPESPAFEWLKSSARPKIRYPAEGMIVALDPDISPANQRIPLETDSTIAATWALNDVAIGNVSSLPVKRGKYSLSLLMPDGKVADQVRFEVR